MSLRDAMRDSAAPHLGPGEPVQAVIGAQTASRWLAAITCVFVFLGFNHKIPAGQETLRVHRRFFKDIEAPTACSPPRPGGTMRSSLAARGGRIAAVLLCAAAAELAPAMAATGPSMTVDGNTVNIAIAGPHNSLKFYWAVNGSATWHAETIAGAGTTFSAPSMTVNGNSVNIAAMGPNHKLTFYWAVNGSPTWHVETVAGVGSTFSAPSMTVNHNSVNIAAMGPGNRLKFYWAVNGTATWHPETVAGIGSVL